MATHQLESWLRGLEKLLLPQAPHPHHVDSERGQSLGPPGSLVQAPEPQGPSRPGAHSCVPCQPRAGQAAPRGRELDAVSPYENPCNFSAAAPGGRCIRYRGILNEARSSRWEWEEASLSEGSLSSRWHGLCCGQCGPSPGRPLLPAQPTAQGPWWGELWSALLGRGPHGRERSPTVPAFDKWNTNEGSCRW